MKFNVRVIDGIRAIQSVPNVIEIPNTAMQDGVEFFQPEDVLSQMGQYINTDGLSIEYRGKVIKLGDLYGHVAVELIRQV